MILEMQTCSLNWWNILRSEGQTPSEGPWLGVRVEFFERYGCQSDEGRTKQSDSAPGRLDVK